MGRIDQQVAEHLALSPHDRVYRRELRAQLPAGTVKPRPGGGKHNSVSSKVRDSLCLFERHGWIRRDAEAAAVEILDRAALWEFSQG
ncbi:hypothetical protein [Nocardioides mangrovi]|uniref:MarR family transcriptional regulator n=1 Tax=Nocardioides mangrovi TaxID=2874580 RepID=A0ABS7U981_9ACTN|nr:hypothetical protein [Nocardioides mangrovi]MBZ5737506.1 hypothetical protein [Nocardioides mangrovi]